MKVLLLALLLLAAPAAFLAPADAAHPCRFGEPCCNHAAGCEWLWSQFWVVCDVTGCRPLP